MDNPYEDYVDEWNEDIPTIGDDTIDQDVAGNNDSSDTGGTMMMFSLSLLYIYIVT